MNWCVCFMRMLIRGAEKEREHEEKILVFEPSGDVIIKIPRTTNSLNAEETEKELLLFPIARSQRTAEYFNRLFISVIFPSTPQIEQSGSPSNPVGT